MALTFFRSPFLEKKIRVLSEFTDFVQRASEQKSEPNLDLMAPPEKKKFKYINNLKLKQWIIQKELLDYIIGDRFHVEIFKRAVVIIKFLASEGALADQHIDQLWKYTSDSQEGSVKTVYKTFVELSTDASVENLDYMFTKIKEIPMEKYDDYIINMIRDFSLNAMARVNAPVFKRKTPKYEFYGFTLLYKAILDSSKLEQEYFQAAFNAIVTLGKNPNFKGVREKCMRSCCENVRKGTSVPQSLYLILHILSSYSTSTFLRIESHIKVIVEEAADKLQSEYNMFDSVIKNMSMYLEKVSAEIEKQKAKGITIENKRNYRFEGRYSHEKNIEARLVFLENIGLQLEKAEFGLAHLKKLWSILYKRSITEVERTEFLFWMTKYREKNGEKRYILGENLMKGFFTSVLCSPEQTDNFKIYTPELFRCFEKYFQCLNEAEGNIVNTKGTERVVKYEKLIGLDVLWKIFLNCPNEKVLKSVTNILVKVHLKIYSPELGERMAIWQKFMDKSLECIHRCKETQNHKQISNIISLINSFVMSFDGKEYIRDGKETGSQEPLSFIVVDKNNENSRKVVDIAPNGTIFLLRKKIAEAFGVGNYDFEICTSGGFKIPTEVEEDNPASAICILK